MAESKINNALKVAVISKDVTTIDSPDAMGGHYAYIDLTNELNSLLQDYTKAKVVIPIGATITSDNGDGGLLIPYSVNGDRLRQFALNTNLNATYRCYFAVMY